MILRGPQKLGSGIRTSRIRVLKLVLQWLPLALGQRLDESERVLASNGVDDIIRRGSEKLRNDGELVDVVLAGEKGLALEHLSKNATGTPDVHLDIVFLPCEHDLGGSVVSGGDVSGHLGVLDTRETEVADLQIAVLVDKDVAGLEITVDDTSRVDIFQATLF